MLGRESRKIRICSISLAVLTLVLVGLGGFVRATGAGLACPDWPLCFGRVIPEFSIAGVPQEWIHRVLASVVSLLTVYLAMKSFQNRSRFKNLFKIVLGLLVLLAVQVVLGGLTVLMTLNPFIVTSHLALGTLFFLALGLIAVERGGQL